MKILKILLIVTFCIGFLGISAITTYSYFKISGLNKISDPESFIRTFNSEDYSPVILHKCVDWDEFLYGACRTSEYFPYKRLGHQNIMRGTGINIVTINGVTKNLTKPSAWLLKDSFWNIFYILYTDGSHSAQYYGPFKMVN